MYRVGIKYGSDKLTHHGYHRFYDYFLSEYRKKSMNFLEIGVDSGSSLKMWGNYFTKAKIFGMDIDHSYTHSRGIVFKGDQSKLEDLKKLKNKIKKSDLIIDDGSHVPEHQLLTFNYLFDSLLLPGGLYIIEDIETSYWKRADLYGYNIRAGFNKKNNIVNIFKNTVDIINREFLQKDELDNIIDTSLVKLENLRHISFIMFGQNCIIIKKMSRSEYAKYGNRKYRFNDHLKKTNTN